MQELAGLLLNTESFEQLMQQIAQLTAQTVPGTLTCGITVGNGNRVITVASADDLGAQLDEYQYDLDEGPCLEALRTGQVVSAPDLATDRRWGAYPGIATAHGVAAIHASPLQTAGGTVGVLNLYSDEVGGFDSDTRQHLIAQFAAVGAVGISSTLRNSGDVQLTRQLTNALSTRAVIDQAIGIVMATRNCTAAEAFTTLRTLSQTRNVRLARIAQDLVDRTGT